MARRRQLVFASSVARILVLVFIFTLARITLVVFSPSIAIDVPSSVYFILFPSPLRFAYPSLASHNVHVLSLSALRLR